MTLSALLADLTRAGVRLTLGDGHIEVDAPPRVLSPALLDDLKAHKPNLLEILSPPAGPCQGCGSAVLIRLVTGGVVCPGCCAVPAEAIAEKVVWNDELAGVESLVLALRVSKLSR